MRPTQRGTKRSSVPPRTAVPWWQLPAQPRVGTRGHPAAGALLGHLPPPPAPLSHPLPLALCSPAQFGLKESPKFPCDHPLKPLERFPLCSTRCTVPARKKRGGKRGGTATPGDEEEAGGGSIWGRWPSAPRRQPKSNAAGAALP